MYPGDARTNTEDHILCAVFPLLYCTIVHISRPVFPNTWFNVSLIE